MLWRLVRAWLLDHSAGPMLLTFVALVIMRMTGDPQSVNPLGRDFAPLSVRTFTLILLSSLTVIAAPSTVATDIAVPVSKWLAGLWCAVLAALVAVGLWVAAPFPVTANYLAVGTGALWGVPMLVAARWGVGASFIFGLVQMMGVMVASDFASGGLWAVPYHAYPSHLEASVGLAATVGAVAAGARCGARQR